MFSVRMRDYITVQWEVVKSSLGDRLRTLIIFCVCECMHVLLFWEEPRVLILVQSTVCKVKQPGKFSPRK